MMPDIADPCCQAEGAWRLAAHRAQGSQRMDLSWACCDRRVSGHSGRVLGPPSAHRLPSKLTDGRSSLTRVVVPGKKHLSASRWRRPILNAALDTCTAICLRAAHQMTSGDWSRRCVSCFCKLPNHVSCWPFREPRFEKADDIILSSPGYCP